MSHSALLTIINDFMTRQSKTHKAKIIGYSRLSSAMYDSDQEYRAFLRTIIGMDPAKFYETEDIKCDPTDPNVSAETIDEYNYDADAVKTYLDQIYANTHSRPEFKRLYTAAAALMFSENPEIGLAVLMSYDYLAYFYNCYHNYLKSPEKFTESDEFYNRLITRIESK